MEQHQQQQQLQTPSSGGGGGGPHLPDEDVNNSSSSGNRWPREETLALLKIRSDMDSLFRDATLKAPLWDEVSRKLMELGYKRNSKKCKEKFENVHKYYKRTKEGKGGSRQDGKSYRFFSELEAMYNITINNNPQPNSQNLAPQVPQMQMQVSAPTPIASAPPISAASKLISFSSTNSFSSEFEEDEGGEERAMESGGKKRKREESGGENSEGRMMEFFEGLMKQVMERQEQMQRQFMEALERREQERLVREEAWRKQEMARIARESEIAANERAAVAARDRIICSFLQKTGQTIPTSTPATPATLAIPPATPATPVTSQTQKQIITTPMETPTGPQVVDPTSSRWPKAEVHALIRLRSELDSRYQDNGAKGPLWEEISYGMQRLGYNRNAKRCKEKRENINKYFRKVKESNKKRPEDAKTCPYFHQLDALYRNKGFNNNGDQKAGLGQNPVSIAAPMILQGESSNNGGDGNASRDLFGSGDSMIMKKPEDIVKELTVRSNDSSNPENVDGDEEYDEE